MKTRHWILIAIAGAALLAASAFLSSRGLKTGDPAPNFTLTDTNGAKVALSELRGQPVIVQFWGSWCGQCMAELPRLNEFTVELKELNVSVLAISVDDPSDAEYVRSIAENILPNLTVLFDDNSKTADAYKSFFLPDTFIIDENGNIFRRFEGTAGLDWTRGAAHDAILELVKRGETK